MAGKEWYTVVGYWGDAYEREIWHVEAYGANDAITLVNRQEGMEGCADELEDASPDEREEIITNSVKAVEGSLAICAVFLGKHECQCT